MLRFLPVRNTVSPKDAVENSRAKGAAENPRARRRCRKFTRATASGNAAAAARRQRYARLACEPVAALRLRSGGRLPPPCAPTDAAVPPACRNPSTGEALEAEHDALRACRPRPRSAPYVPMTRFHVAGVRKAAGEPVGCESALDALCARLPKLNAPTALSPGRAETCSM